MTPDPNRELMQKIRDQWGTLIGSVSSGSEIPEEFLAALVANESGGNPNAKRFEPQVLVHLWEVLLGRKASFGNITKPDVLKFITGIAVLPDVAPLTIRADSFQSLDGLATSWGLTQIMGYDLLEGQLESGIATFDKLRDPGHHLTLAIILILRDLSEFKLKLPGDASFVFRCWNTGHPSGVTFDPQYVANGLARMEFYKETRPTPPPEEPAEQSTD
jgi:hypothetical protein